MKIWTFVLALSLSLVGFHADAKRMGGGKSFGQQSNNVTQRQAAPPQNAAKPAAPAPTAAAAPKRPWGAMLGGLAAGLGLAWLANSLGMGEGFGQMLMFGLLALGIMMAVGWFMRSRKAAQAQHGGAPSPFAFQGASPAPVAASPAAYSPANVGNDASARPWERNSMSFDGGDAGTAPGSMIGSAIVGSQGWGVPRGL